MTKTIRLSRIREYLKANTSATVNELSELLEVSHMTIRRDLTTMAENGSVKILHGAVLYVNDEHSDQYRMASARTNMLEAKKRIARQAVKLIDPGDIIIIDAGSTGELIATYLPEDIPITVICYALNIATTVASKQNCSLIVTGGYYHESSMVLESREGLELLKQNRANKAFITASGVSERLGVTCSNFFERATKHSALTSSETGVLVADSSKFGQIKTGHFADLEDFDILITDTGLEDSHRRAIERMSHKRLYVV